MKNSIHLNTWFNTRGIVLAFLLLACSAAFGQNRVVTGVVSDESGETLPGVSVIVKGTSEGTATDIDGSYSLMLPADAEMLVFSFVGMRPQEVSIDGRSEISVVMEIASEIMDEVVVVGYGTQLRSQITGSVSTVGEEEISSTPSLRVEQALQGRTSGVTIAQNSGQPGAPLSVRIRGVGTINNSDPLYIVDGFPTGGIDYLNPGDIESINVLKDAASAAIYGARGANGVILITTKQGKINQRPTIDYDMYYGIQEPWKTINLLSAEEYAIISNEMRLSEGLPPLPELANPAALGEGTDWLDAIFERAPMSNHNFTIKGGGERSTYALTASFFDQDGIVGGEKSNFQRKTFRVNGRHQLFERFAVGNVLTYTNINRNALPENNEFNTPLVRALNMDPVTPVYKPDGTFAYSQYADTDIANPVNAIDKTYDDWTTNRIVGNFFAELEIIKGLTLKSNYTVDLSLGTSDRFFPSYDLSNDTAISDAPPAEKVLINGVLTQDNKWSTWQWENTAHYTKTINEKHNFSFLAGVSALDWKYVWHGGSKNGLPTNDPEAAFIDNAQDELSQRSWNGSEEFSFLSYFGRINYDYEGKYLLSATMRRDGSSRFGKDNRYGNFPSVSAGWVVSEEDFFANIPVFDFMKVRASWGANGNAEIGNYSFTSQVLAGQNYTLGTDQVIVTGSGPVATSNPDLKWEENFQTDIGIDLGLLDGRVNVTMDYFNKKTKDMLAVVPIPLVVGFEPAVSNVGTMVNQGFEFEAEYRKFTGKFKWDVGFNVAFINNEVTSLGLDGDPIFSGRVQSANANVARTEVGFPVASFYGYVTDGIFQNEGEVSAHAIQDGAQPGDIRFVDLNGDGIIDTEDQTFIGNPTPDFIYGINASAEFAGFDLAIFLQGTQGNDIYNATVRYDFTYVNRPVHVLNRWTGEGTSNDEPRVSLSDPNQNARVSDRFVEDGSYLRIKNIQLGYNLPASVLETVNMRRLRVYVGAQNLFTFTSYTGLDPEIGNRGNLEIGIDRGFYPQARTFLVGLQTTF